MIKKKPTRKYYYATTSVGKIYITNKEREKTKWREVIKPIENPIKIKLRGWVVIEFNRELGLTFHKIIESKKYDNHKVIYITKGEMLKYNTRYMDFLR